MNISVFVCGFIAGMLLLTNISTLAQLPTPPATMISIEANNLPLEKVLQMIEKQTTFRFAYATYLISQQKAISCKIQSSNLPELLRTIFRGTDITYAIIGNHIVLKKMNGAENITINGYVKDSKTGEVLIGASIALPGNKTGTSSNNYGFYSITVPRAEVLNMQVTYVGYTIENKVINADKSVSVDVILQQPEEVSNYVTVLDQKKGDNKINQSGIIELTNDIMANSSSVSGDGDIIKSVQMQPGVQSSFEGTPGFFVRGGDAGQNLVQLDEATLYNPSHLFGLVSVFNTAAIKKATLLKDGFPASYGDHISSVVDIAMKDGNNQQLGGNIQIGNIVSGLTLFGPLKKDKSSFLVSARRSMLDFLLKPFAAANYYSNYSFYDINAKINYRFSSKDRVFISFYKGLDNNSFHDETPVSSSITYGNRFGNQALTFRWNHLFSKKLFSNTSFIYNDYFQSLSAIQDDYFAKLYSGITDFNVKTDLYFYPGQNHKIKGGINFLQQHLFPAKVSDKISPAGNITSINPDEIPEKNTNRFAAYLSDETKLGRRWNIYAGVRVPMFFTKDARYVNIEPRVSIQYMVNPTTYFKTAYTEMHQYIHLVQSYNSSFPAEIWFGSNNVVKPQFGQQLSTGLFKNLRNEEFQVGAELYYKLMNNQLLFKGGIEPVINNNFESNLIFGKAWSYGAEFSVTKKKGKLTGSVAYSFAYTYQQFDSLNLGQKFPFAHDRRHSIYFSSSYAINSHWTISANFSAASSRYFTINTRKNSTVTDSNPLYDEGDHTSNGSNGNGGNGSSGGNGGNSGNGGSGGNGNSGGNGGGFVNISSIEINNYQLTPYNRLDLNISYKKTKQVRKGTCETEWSLAIYNVYARNNIFLAYRAIDPVTRLPIAKIVTFIPVIPTLTYHFKF